MGGFVGIKERIYWEWASGQAIEDDKHADWGGKASGRTSRRKEGQTVLEKTSNNQKGGFDLKESRVMIQPSGHKEGGK